MTDITSPIGVGGVTTTTGTSAFVISGPLAAPGGGSYRLWSTVPNGARVLCLRSDLNSGGGNFELSVVDVSNVGGVVTLSPNPRVSTSAGGTTPVSWAGGSQDVTVQPGSIHAANAGSEFAPYAAAFRASIGLAIGSSVGQLVAWVTGPKYPAGDGSLLTNLPAGTPSVPSGARFLGYAASPPSGWTLVTGLNDMVIYVTDGSGGNPAPGSTGGIPGAGASAWDNSWGITSAAHALTIPEMPSHTHDVSSASATLGSGAIGVSLPSAGPGGTLLPGSANATGGGASHSHAISSAKTWRPPGIYAAVWQKT